MASYETTIVIPRSIEDAFAFISNFQNAPLWDPRTYAAEKKTSGTIGVGTRFVLNGGLFPLRVFPFAKGIATTILGMPLTYDVVTYEPPRELELEGETPLFRYRDRLELIPVGSQTRLIYSARLELKGPFAIGEPLLKRMFQRIGDDATANIADAVTRGLAPSYAERVHQLSA